MKKAVLFCLVLFGSVLFVFAGGGRDTGPWPHGRPINFVIPWAVGGGTDIGARLLVPYLERELGTTVTVTNPTGAAGWVGWERVLATPPDGFTITMVNMPAVQLGYMDPRLGRRFTVEDFEFIGNHVTDPMGFAIRPDETRFHDLQSLIEFNRNNYVTGATTGLTSPHTLLMAQFQPAVGTDITLVPHTGFGESLTAFLGGHVDVLIATVGEFLVPEQQGRLRTIVLFTEADYNPLMPDVPVFNRMGISTTPIHTYSQRGLAVRRGTPPEIVQILTEAVRNAVNDPSHIARMTEVGLHVDYIPPAQHTIVSREHEDVIRRFRHVFGW